MAQDKMGSIGPPRTLWGRLARDIDWVIISLTFPLVVMAMINLNSAGNGDWTGFVVSQVRWLIIGAAVMGAAASIDYRVYYRLGYAFYGVGVGLLALVAIVGVTTNSAERWLKIGSFFQFQPSEPMKMMLVIGIARFLQDIPEDKPHSLRGLIGPAVMALIPAAFIVKQPNLSTAVVILLIATAMLSLTELTWRRVLIIGSVGAVGLLIAWRVLMREYQQERIDVWLDPEAHADAGGYQILQARAAVGNGGIFGRGANQGTQNVLDFVPYGESDFVLAVFAEEWGYLGTTLVLLLFMSLVLWSLNIASQARDRFSAHLCVGVGALIFLHTVLNVGVVLEFFPNTGLPLPFFSNGGSNVLTVMFGLGVLMSVSRTRHRRS